MQDHKMIFQADLRMFGVQQYGILQNISRNLKNFIKTNRRKISIISPVALNKYKLDTSIIRIVAVGDIHGRADLLRLAFRAIDEVGKDGGAPVAEIYLGDYIDRGPSSSEVVELLMNRVALRRCVIPLMGNHESMLLEGLMYEQSFQRWLKLGGRETVVSYLGTEFEKTPSEKLREVFARKIPQNHLIFIKNLRYSVHYRNIFFSHAGVRPNVPLALQRAEDLMWISEPFQSYTKKFEALVVHGHTPNREPQLLHNRICVDTGAYHTGRLTGILLSGAGARIVQVKI